MTYPIPNTLKSSKTPKKSKNPEKVKHKKSKTPEIQNPQSKKKT